MPTDAAQFAATVEPDPAAVPVGQDSRAKALLAVLKRKKHGKLSATLRPMGKACLDDRAARRPAFDGVCAPIHLLLQPA